MHSGTSLARDDLTVVNGISCTAVPRTLLDLATQVEPRSLKRSIDRAEELRRFDLTALDELLARSRGRRGVQAIATILADYTGPTGTRSDAEDRLLEIVEDAHLPAPAVNTWIPLPEGGGYSPDFLWRAERLIVEVDSRTYHARSRAFRHDRKRDRRLALLGFETRRYAASEVFSEPRRVGDELRAFLDNARR